MIHGHYIVSTIRAHRVLLVFAFLIVGLFQVLINVLVVGADLLSMIEQFYRQMPPQMQVFLGEQFFARFSIDSAVAFGYAHPLVLVMMCFVAILIPARHLAGEIEGGTMELLLALPVRRPSIVLSLWVSSAIVLWWLVMGCWVGTGIGFLIYPETRTIPFLDLAAIGVNLWLLTLAISSYALVIASFVREGGAATVRAAGLTVFFYFLNVTAVMWPTIQDLQPVSIFYYHQPQQIISEASPLTVPGIVLGGIIILAVGIALRQMSRRDIPG